MMRLLASPTMSLAKLHTVAIAEMAKTATSVVQLTGSMSPGDATD